MPMQPRPMAETTGPPRPSFRCFMIEAPACRLRAAIKPRSPLCHPEPRKRSALRRTRSDEPGLSGSSLNLADYFAAQQCPRLLGIARAHNRHHSNSHVEHLKHLGELDL